MSQQQAPTIGRIVHYVLAHGPHAGEHRPAIIVRVWGAACVNLQVFTDTDSLGKANDAPAAWSAASAPGPLQWATSVLLDGDTHLPNTWHWPERV